MGIIEIICLAITLPACIAPVSPAPPVALVTRELQLPPTRAMGFEENAAGQARYGIEFKGQQRSFQLYAKGTSSTPRPAILLLHGSKRSGVSLVQKWKDLADRENIILIGPTAAANWNPNGDDAFAFIDQVLQSANMVHPIDPNRIYLFGHSMGANYALMLAAGRSQVFAAASIHAGQLRHRGEQLVAKAQRKIPVLIMNGTRDKAFPMGPVTKTAEIFAKFGHPTLLYVLKNHTHWYYDDAPTINAMAWQFLSFYTLQGTAAAQTSGK